MAKIYPENLENSISLQQLLSVSTIFPLNSKSKFSKYSGVLGCALLLPVVVGCCLMGWNCLKFRRRHHFPLQTNRSVVVVVGCCLLSLGEIVWRRHHISFPTSDHQNINGLLLWGRGLDRKYYHQSTLGWMKNNFAMLAKLIKGKPSQKKTLSFGHCLNNHHTHPHTLHAIWPALSLFCHERWRFFALFEIASKW